MPSLTSTITRQIVTPVTIVLFVVSTVTGIMLLLHWNGNLVRFSHEWLSVGFSAIGLWHLARNWAAFLQYFKRNVALSAFVVSVAGSLVFTAMTGTPASTGGPGAMMRAVANAPLATVAPVFGLDADKAVQALKAANIEAQPGESLSAIGSRAGMNAVGVANILTAAKQPKPASNGPAS